jgi:hypothetical protein
MSARHGSYPRKFACMPAAAILAILAPSQLRADTMTACTTLSLCYCVNKDFVEAINANIARVRQLIVEQRNQGKAIGYLSIPLSTVGGSYFGVNLEIAQQAKARIEKRYGAHSVWLLNPGAEGNLPAKATGADYMLMWTKILEGRNGLGEDFDFVYFVGPTTVGQFFSLDGNADMEKIDTYFDKRAASDESLKQAIAANKITKATFRNYYALRASVAFSYGSHDEWNIARLLNERRRGATDFGIAKQISVLFDGNAVPPGDYETGVASGDVGRCVN